MSAYWDFHSSDEYMCERIGCWEFPTANISHLMAPIDMSGYANWSKAQKEAKYQEFFQEKLDYINDLCNGIVDSMAWHSYEQPDVPDDDYIDGGDIVMLKAMLTSIVKMVNNGTYPTRKEMH